MNLKEVIWMSVQWFSYYPYRLGFRYLSCLQNAGRRLGVDRQQSGGINGTLKLSEKNKGTLVWKTYPYTSGNLFSKQGFLYGRF